MMYWYSLGTIALIYLSFQDIYKNMRVDERKNYFMLGLTTSLINYYKPKILFLIGLLIFIILFIFLLKTFVGVGDLQALMWLLLGYGLINKFLIIYFLINLIFIIIVWFVAKKILYYNKKLPTKNPMFPLLLISFVSTNLIF